MFNSFENKFHVFIDGSVGVGKTTLLLNLKRLFQGNSLFCIREYIDYNGIAEGEAENRLADVLSGKASNYEFQKFILGITEYQLESDEFKTAHIIIWERHPIKSLEVFARGTVTRDEYDLLVKTATDLLKKFSVPECITYNIIDTSSKTKELISDMAYHAIIQKMLYNTRYVGIKLKCSNIVDQLYRINTRGRECEKKQYADISKLKQINSAYN